MQCLVDSEEGFEKLGEEIKAPSLRRYFLEESSTRAQFLTELEAVLFHEGIENNKETGTFAAALNRAWGDLKAALGGSDHGLLVTAEAGEDHVREAYRNALDMELPFPLQQLLIAQAERVQDSHDFVRTARDSTK
jgi:uncharacterized protein (TIGR02284 family)